MFVGSNNSLNSLANKPAGSACNCDDRHFEVEWGILLANGDVLGTQSSLGEELKLSQVCSVAWTILDLIIAPYGAGGWVGFSGDALNHVFPD